MSQYYQQHLSAERLERCYALAPSRIRQYLEAEATYAAGLVGEGREILELGCGYGRLMTSLSRSASHLVGIDNSLANLRYGKEYLSGIDNCSLVLMDASRLAFRDGCFDMVFCLQNGISAFHIDPPILMAEALRVTAPEGTALFTSYSSKIWAARLEWFEIQAKASLLGEIDHQRTGNGKIVCKDGFTATTVSAGQFAEYAQVIGAKAKVTEIDASVVVCELYRENRID